MTQTTVSPVDDSDPMDDWVITRVGVNPTLLISTDFPIAVAQDGNLYYPSGRPGHLQLMRATPSGATSVFATLPLTVTGQPLPYIGGLIGGPDGSLYYTEDSAIKRITPQGRIGTAVTIRAPARAPSVPATDQHPYLRGLAVDARGVMYVADTGDTRVLKDNCHRRDNNSPRNSNSVVADRGCCFRQ